MNKEKEYLNDRINRFNIMLLSVRFSGLFREILRLILSSTILNLLMMRIMMIIIIIIIIIIIMTTASVV
jgi:hypothetical protein